METNKREKQYSSLQKKKDIKCKLKIIDRLQ